MEWKHFYGLVKLALCTPLALYYILEVIALSFLPERLRYKNVNGETALITGAGNGLGREIAIGLSKRGCRVVLVDINREGMEDTKNAIAEISGEAFVYECDVSKREEVYAMAAKIKDEVGNVTILVNNAGIVTGKKFLECPDEKIVKTFEVNALAHFWTCKAFLPDMMKNNHGHLVSICSMAGLGGSPRLSDYCSSKSAAIIFMESIRIELLSEKLNGIKSTIVCPYQINTGLFDGIKLNFSGTLTTEYAAREVISAILTNKEMLCLPWYFRIPVILKWILPPAAQKLLMKVSGLVICMNDFKGRKNVE